MKGIGKNLPEAANMLVCTVKERVFDGRGGYYWLTDKKCWNTICV
jgi:hypothetical protein